MEVPPFFKIAIAAAVGMAGGYAVSNHQTLEVIQEQADAAEREADARLVARVQAVLTEPNDRKRLRNLWKIAMKLEPRKIPLFLEQLRVDPISTQKMASELLGEFAAVNPKAAFAYADSLRGVKRKQSIQAVVTAWAEEDEAAAAAWLETLPKGDAQEIAKRALIKSIGMKDLSRFVAMLSERKVPEDISDDPEIWKIWVLKDRALAIASALSLAKGVAQGTAVCAVASALGEIDRKAAIEWAVQLPPGNSREGALITLVKGLMETHPEDLPAIAVNMASPLASRAVFQVAAIQWSRNDATGALSWVEGLSDPHLRQFLFPMILAGWVDVSPQAAIQYAMALQKGPAGAMALQSALGAWVRADFKTATQWMDENSESISVQDRIRLVDSMIGDEDSEVAFKLAASLPVGSEATSSAYEMIARHWAAMDSIKAEAQIEGLEGPARSPFLKGFIWGLAEHDPASAAQKVLELPEGRLRDQIAANLGSQWGASDPSAALQWVETVPGAAKLSEKTVGAIVRQWAVEDLDAASQYLNTLPSGPMRDSVTREFIPGMANEAPEAATRWALSIGDEKQRLGGLRQAMLIWLKHDPAAAKGWIEASSQPPEWKAQMLKGW